MDENKLKELMDDIFNYFNNAKDDNDYNCALAKSYIKKWGAEFTVLSLAWIAKYLRDNADATKLIYLRNEAEGDTFLRNVAIEIIFRAKSIVKAQGLFGITTLLEIIKSTPDEDLCAIAAFILQTCDFLDPGQPGVKEVFQESYQKREGTACKIMLASGLYREGVNKEIMFYIENGYLGDSKIVDWLKSEIRRRFLQPMNQNEVESIIVREMLFPERIGTNNQIMIVPGLIGILALDIASNGLAFMNQGGAWNNWKRKRYND